MRCRMPVVGASVLLLAVGAPALAQSTEPFDHVHLAVSDVERARDWYIQHMGGNAGETPETVAWGKWPGDHPLPVQLLFTLSPDAKPSAGSVLDHIGFSFVNLTATVDALRTAGVKIVSPVADMPGLGKQAVVEDPWGTTLELVEDPDAPGLHHVELRVPDPDAALRFYVRAFGGDRTKYRGIVDAIRYRDLGVFYLFAVRDDRAEPSAGRTIDHIAFGPIELERLVNALRAEGASFTSNPNPRINPACRFVVVDEEHVGRDLRRLYCAQPDQLAHRTVYLEGPGGVQIELLQHLEAGGH